VLLLRSILLVLLSHSSYTAQVSLMYVKHYQHRRERECSSTTIAVLALTVALTTLALVPVDIFLVSQQKLSSDGTYKFSAAQVSQSCIHSSARSMTTFLSLLFFVA
jgi:hypothetical protein